MKKVFVGVIMFCIVLLIGLDIKIMRNMEEMKSNAKEERDLLQSQIDDLNQEKKENQTIKGEKEEKTAKVEKVPVGEVSKDKFKVCNDGDTMYYTKEEEQKIEKIVDVKIENKKVYLTIDPENEAVKSIIGREKQIKSVEDEEITGFSGVPEEVYFADFGQDIGEQKILILMEDDSVEYIDITDMLENQEYKSDGKIKGLENIQQFDLLSVSDTEGGGYVTTIAIDKDGYYYDINELL